MRTFIQIDVQNLFFSAKDMNKRIDFKRLKEHFIATGDQLVGINAYTIRTPDAKANKFEAFMRAMGYTICAKQAMISYGPEGHRIYKGTDQDMAVCIDCMQNLNNFDKWVLMSGDGDFIDLCKHLKKCGKVIEVWSIPGVSFNKSFCDYVDAIKFLNEQFFYEKNEDPRQDDIKSEEIKIDATKQEKSP